MADQNKKKKKVSRTVEEGRIYIKATFNNTLVTITDVKGNPILTSSCGMHGFSGTRKSTPHAATITTDAAVRKAISDYGMQTAEIFVKGIGPGREASLRAIKSTQLDIKKITDITPIPHNGVRPPKIRRV
ncbi:MAG: 30S ribosomal protein S11 [Patescibacteria group bacterium]|nr:30S ribosomal protein S11 [Patescibacteria group bacterium]